MSGGQTKNATLSTALAFHYQALIGLDKCFSLQEEQAVWFESDGDVSLKGDSPEQSSQTEVKDYSAPLTDHHENLWNTLSNWLDPKFDHNTYGALVLHTTQAFGAKTSLKSWNTLKPEQRLKILKGIYGERTAEQLNAKSPSKIIKLQKSVMDGREDSELMALLEKVVLHTEADDLAELRLCFYRKLDGSIPKANQQAYVEGLIGFVYEQADKKKWIIEKNSFIQKRESLTARYCSSLFTIPDFTQRDATGEEIDEHITELFAQKIIEIEYSEVLPEAVGNWLEFRNSLIEELHGFPQFRVTASRYREQWIKSFAAKYRSVCRKAGDPLGNSKGLYDQVTSEQPFGIDGYPNPDFVFRNGIIHDAMDDEERDLKWKAKP